MVEFGEYSQWAPDAENQPQSVMLLMPDDVGGVPINVTVAVRSIISTFRGNVFYFGSLFLHDNAFPGILEQPGNSLVNWTLIL